METHELTYIEHDEKGYGDGLDDVYVCSCGEEFQANGDIVPAFEHGRAVGHEDIDREMEIRNAR